MYFNLDLFSLSIFAYDQTDNGYAETSLYIPIKKINSLTVGVRRKKTVFPRKFCHSIEIHWSQFRSLHAPIHIFIMQNKNT